MSYHVVVYVVYTWGYRSMNLAISPVNTVSSNQVFNGIKPKQSIRKIFNTQQYLLLSEEKSSKSYNHLKNFDLLKTFLVTFDIGFLVSLLTIPHLGTEGKFLDFSKWDLNNFDMNSLPLIFAMGVLPAALMTGIKSMYHKYHK